MSWEAVQVIYLTRTIRETICENCGIIDDVMRKQLAKMCKAGVLYRFDTNSYILNPELFGLGSWSNIRKLKAQITFKGGFIVESAKGFIKNVIKNLGLNK